MPEPDDLCVWCGKEFQAHIHKRMQGMAVDLCNDTGASHVFLQEGLLTIMHTMTGDKVTLYCTLDRNPTQYRTMCSITGTVVLMHNPTKIRYRVEGKMQLEMDYLVGFRRGEEHPELAYNRLSGIPELVALLTSDYEYGIWVPRSTPIKRFERIQVAPATRQNGMKCAIKSCGTFYEYAEPNLPDGRFVCYSCKSSGRHRYAT